MRIYQFAFLIIAGITGIFCSSGDLFAGGRQLINSSKIYVYDGDTIIVENQRMRLVGIDSPEISKPRCDREKTLGYAARDRLRQIVEHARTVELADGGKRDKYGRPLVTLYADGIDVRRPMMAEGHAIVWRPGRRAWSDRLQHWCGR